MFRGERVTLTFPMASTQSFKLDESGRQIKPPAPLLESRIEPVSEPVIELAAAISTPLPAVIAPIEPESVVDALPAEAILPLWFVGLVSLMSLGICAALGWLLRPSAASRDLLAQLKAQLADESEAETA